VSFKKCALTDFITIGGCAMYKAIRSIFVVLAITLFALGCSGTGMNPLAPIDNPGEADPGITTGDPDPIREPVSERVLWGLWNVTFDAAMMEVVIVPERNAQAHFNVTNMILPPACDDCFAITVNSFDPVTHILDADVTLRNPTPIGGYDVRGILHTNDYGHLLTNPDDWTDYWDMPGGGEINPFIAFAKDQPGRKFAGNTSHEENFQVFIPTPPAYFALTFAVDASFPTNCPEPYSISDFVQDGILYQFNTATVDLFVAVHDWQGDVNSVKLSSEDLIGSGFLDFELLAGPVWRATLTNTQGAPTGEYEVMIEADSGTPPSVPLYDFFTVTVSETTEPVVTGIDPGYGELDTTLTTVVVVGDNFIAPAEIVLSPALGSPIGVLNLTVENENLITFDLDIPIDAEIGLYDVELTNGDAKLAVGEDLFEVTNPNPVVTDIDPTSGYAGEIITDVAITGEFFMGPATVEFILPESGSFSATNIVVVDMNSITCDIDIPFEAALGIYDIKVTNTDTKFATGADLFEVQCPIPTVTDTDPGSVLTGTPSINVEITGTNFYGSTADVVLKKTGAPDIIAINVTIDNGTMLHCDIFPPWGAALGYYDVEVTNSCGETGTGAGLLEVTLPDPYGWARTFGGPTSDEGYSVTVDSDGNSYVTGYFEGAVDFDPGPGQTTLISNGEADAFLCKFNAYGFLMWATSWGGSSYDEPENVAIDDMGNVYVIGDFADTVDFDPGPGIENHTSAGHYDVFLSKFDSDGNFQQAFTWGSSGYDAGYGVAVDGSGNVYISGHFENTVDFDPDPADEDNHTSIGNQDIFILKLDSTGDFAWGNSWGGAGDEYCFTLSADNAGNVYAAGRFSGNVDFDPHPVDTDWHDGGTSNNAFVSKFDADGDFQWAHNWGASDTQDNANGVTVEDGGNYVYISGSFRGTGIDFDPDPVDLDSHDSVGDSDAFLVKLDSSGDFQWCNTWGGLLYDGAYAGVAINALGDVFVGGGYRDECDFDPDPMDTTEHTSAGESDSFISKFDSAGEFYWVRVWGSETYDYCENIATNSSGEVWITGAFYYTIDFNPDPVDIEDHTAFSEDDVYLMKLMPDGLW